MITVKIQDYDFAINIIDSTHCSMKCLSFSNHFSIPWHINQLDTKVVEQLNEQGVIRDGRYFKVD